MDDITKLSEKPGDLPAVSVIQAEENILGVFGYIGKVLLYHAPQLRGCGQGDQDGAQGEVVLLVQLLVELLHTAQGCSSQGSSLFQRVYRCLNDGPHGEAVQHVLLKDFQLC